MIFDAIWCYLTLFDAIWHYLTLFAKYLTLFAKYLTLFDAICQISHQSCDERGFHCFARKSLDRQVKKWPSQLHKSGFCISHPHMNKWLHNFTPSCRSTYVRTYVVRTYLRTNVRTDICAFWFWVCSTFDLAVRIIQSHFLSGCTRHKWDIYSSDSAFILAVRII